MWGEKWEGGKGSWEWRVRTADERSWDAYLDLGGTPRGFAKGVNKSRDAQASGWNRTVPRNVCGSSTRQLVLLGFYCVEPATAAARFNESA
jgi:hypothetical protein